MQIITIIICQLTIFLCFQALYPLQIYKELNNPNINLQALIGLKEKSPFFDIVVYGDELPAIASAVMARRVYGNKSLRIALLRPNASGEPLAGLITRGGLAYLDRNQINSSLKASSAFYEEIMRRAKVKQVSIEPKELDKVSRQILIESDIEIISEIGELEPLVENNKIYALQEKNTKKQYRAYIFIDGSQNADLARQTDLKYTTGFEGLGFPSAILPISPIFTTQNLSIEQLQKIENQILHNPILMNQIKYKVQNDIKDEDYAKWLLKDINKPMFIGKDYIDLRSIALGVAYHLHCNKPYNLKNGFLFDRANIAILKNNKLSWNAFLYKLSAGETIDLINKNSSLNHEMLFELSQMEKWLNSFEVKKNIKIIAPSEVYIRNLFNITDVIDPLSGDEMIAGGLSEEKAFGTFCYPFDIRGGIEGLEGIMPKPIFNFGIEHCLTKIENFAVIGSSAGYTGLGISVGRILELNTNIASGIGAAAALSLQENKPLNQINSVSARLAIK